MSATTLGSEPCVAPDSATRLVVATAGRPAADPDAAGQSSFAPDSIQARIFATTGGSSSVWALRGMWA